jgi:hypothetical protein
LGFAAQTDEISAEFPIFGGPMGNEQKLQVKEGAAG